METTPAHMQYQQPNYVPVQMVPNVYAAPIKQPSGWGKLWAAFGLALAVQFIQVIFVLIGLLSLTDDGMMAVAEIGGGIAALLFILALGGKKLSFPSLEGMGETWRILKWIFIVDIAVAVIDAIAVITDGSFELATFWPLRVVTLLLLCAGIGLFEEATFRGLMFHGLLARMGTNAKGVFWAIVISSFVFGIMHVDFFGINWGDPSQVLQAFLKVAQTGVFGFAAAAAVLKTGNIWPVALLHGLNDFLLMFVSNGLMQNPVTTEYVSEGSDGLLAIGVYLVLIIAYIPSLVVALRVLKEHNTPDRGQFYRPRVYPIGYAAAPTVAVAMPQQAYGVPQQIPQQMPQYMYQQAPSYAPTPPYASSSPQQVATPQPVAPQNIYPQAPLQ